MAKESVSWTQRIGGNRTLVLAVVISILILFTVETYVVQAIGVGKRSSGFVRFTVNGRVVTMDQGSYQSLMSDWQRFQQGQARFTGRQRGGQQDFLSDLMLAELAHDAGLSIPDATLREYIRINPLFADSSGEFDPKRFDEALKGPFGGLRPKAFEEQGRLALLVTHFVTLYDEAYRIVNDEEAWKRWKGDYPKIGIAYTWSATSVIRSAMKTADLKPEEIEAYWKGTSVQDRHRLKPRYQFEAAALRIDEVDDAAYVQAREEWKDDPDLKLKKDANVDEGYDFFFGSRNTDFVVAAQKPDVVEALRKENEEAVKKEDEEAKKAAGGAASDPAAKSPAVDVARVPADKLDDREVYRRYWRHRVEKELWLRKLFGKVIRASSGGTVPLAKAVEGFSRPGIRFRLLDQEEAIDQYAIEKVKGFGNPNCDLRYVMNEKKKEDEGKVHPEVLYMTTDREKLEEVGWLVFRVTKVVPEEVPPLDTVKDAVAAELLDDRARDRARADLEALRKAAEDARRPLEEVAKEKGFETSTTVPFNAYSWRPPTPKPATGIGVPEVPGSLAEGWKDPNRRLAAVMSRYSALRDVPVGNFGPVLEDYSGSGAFYLAQVKAREEPAFAEMTQGQISMFKRSIGRERLGNMAKELTYGGLRNRLALTIDGKPAPDPETTRGAR
jgi:hypothetical protein